MECMVAKKCGYVSEADVQVCDATMVRSEPLAGNKFN